MMQYYIECAREGTYAYTCDEVNKMFRVKKPCKNAYKAIRELEKRDWRWVESKEELEDGTLITRKSPIKSIEVWAVDIDTLEEYDVLCAELRATLDPCITPGGKDYTNRNIYRGKDTITYQTHFWGYEVR